MIPDGIKLIKASDDDVTLLRELTSAGIPPVTDQPKDYSGLVVLKPWGYEFQVLDTGVMCVWMACLFPDSAVSMHCHQRKQAVFVPLTDGVTLRVLHHSMKLTESIAVDKGVFHSQENNTGSEVFFLEYEWPSEKTDLVRYKDRYGRASKGYEGKGRMITFAEAMQKFNHSALSMFIGEVA